MTLNRRMGELGGEVRKATTAELQGDAVPRPTGQELFDLMSAAEQDELLGLEVAAAVRSGKVKLEDLVVEHRMETEENFIAQATPQDLGIPPRDT